MTQLEQAYAEWVRFRPFENHLDSQVITYTDKTGALKTFVERARFGGNCCAENHFSPDKGPLPDNMVCQRELAWRKYVRIRDGA